MGMINLIEGNGLVKDLALLLNSLPPVEKVEVTTDTKNGRYTFTHENYGINIKVGEEIITLNPNTSVNWTINL